MERGESASTIKVFVRVRPLVMSEQHTDKVTEVLHDDRTIRVVHNSYNHLEIKFDHAFDPDQDQGDIYGHFNNIIPRILDGYNLTIFAYGQTGSGKTHTMFGKSEGVEKGDQVDLSSSSRGIIPRAIEQIFDRISSYKIANVFCSFLQIYNQKIYDLLQNTEKPKPLSVHESKQEGIFVQGLTQFGVTKADDCLELLVQGIKNRVIRQTSMNAKSSRSHSIFQVLLQIQDPKGGYWKGRLNLCDLAGSQKINKKEAMGELQLKQLKNINLSLTTLGKVIYALSSGDKKASGAFRQSKLTRLLQESLTGNTYTFIMANLSPSSKNLEETINTLKFVERANHISLKVKQTQITSGNPDTVGKLQKQIDTLKQLLNLKKQGLSPDILPERINSLRQENQYLKKEYVSKKSLEDLVKDNRNMRKQIHNLQVQLQQSEGTETSLESGYERLQKNPKKKSIMNKYQMDFYMPSSRGEQPSRKSADSKRLSNSLIQAGQSIAFPKRTIQNERSQGQEISPNRQQEKKNLLQRMEQLENKKKNDQYKLIEDYQQFQKKRGRYSPPRPTPGGKLSVKKQESHVIKSRKKVDYSDKIKELEAKLFGK